MAALVGGLGLALACGGGPPDLEQPQSVSTEMVSFSHPGNWTVDVEHSTVDGVAMSIHNVASPSNTVVVVCVYDMAMVLDVASLTDRFLADAAAELGPVDLTETQRVQSLRQLSGIDVTGLKVGFTVSILGVDVPHTQYGYTFETSARSAWVMVQVPDDDHVLEQPGIDLVLDSLKVAP